MLREPFALKSSEHSVQQRLYLILLRALQAYLEIQALKYNHGMLCVITGHEALKYQHGDRQLIMRADALKMRTRQLVHQAADPSEGGCARLNLDVGFATPPWKCHFTFLEGA